MAKKGKKKGHKSNVDLAAKIFGGTVDDDGENAWVLVENGSHSVCVMFDAKGDRFEGIVISEKVRRVEVDENVVARYEHGQR